jgi:predicted Zn-dependent protease
MGSFNRAPQQPPQAPQQPPQAPQQQAPQQQAPQQQVPQQQQVPPQQTTKQQTATRPPVQAQNPYSPPANSYVPPAAGSSNLGGALENMPYDKKVGDYSQQVLRMGGSFARWTNLPVRVHIPMNTPDTWRAPIDNAVRKWAQYLPTVIAPPSETAEIEIGWINHLMPRQLGITNLEIFNGHPRVTVYLLRPSYYPPDVPESTLGKVALHQLGHALGLFGHSTSPGDIMCALDTPNKAGVAKATGISQRDINTLRRIYESPPLPEGFQSPQPISWP